MHQGRIAIATTLLALTGTAYAHATYSIVAVDTATGRFGGAGVSCLGGRDVYIIYAAAPEFGAVHAQAHYHEAGRNRAVELLRQGVAPADILASLTASAFDPSAATRQYALVDTSGAIAAYTGALTGAYSGDRQGRAHGFSYSVQGNLLTSARVLDQAAEAFESGGCDLPERLLRALEAGAKNGEGDRRCTPNGIPADSAFLQVEDPSLSGAYVSFRVPTSGSSDPITQLRAQLDGWRVHNPCPERARPASTADCDCGNAAVSRERPWNVIGTAVALAVALGIRRARRVVLGS